jgi:hypothetical protein
MKDNRSAIHTSDDEDVGLDVKAPVTGDDVPGVLDDAPELYMCGPTRPMDAVVHRT